MIKNSIPLGISVGFIILAILSNFFDITPRIITSLSICSLFFTLSQMLQSFLSMQEEKFRNIIDTYKSLDAYKIDDNAELILKHFSDLIISNKKDKAIKITSYCFEVTGIAALIVGLIVPIKFLENEIVGNVFTFISFALLFINICLMDFMRNKIQLWNKLQIFAKILKKDTNQNDMNNISEEKENV